MKRTLRIPFVLVLAASLLLAVVSPAHAEDVECRGTLASPVVVGNVIVPDDQVCRLNGHEIIGNITVKSRATLDATGISVTGGIQGESPVTIILRDSDIDNNVSIRKAGQPVTRDPADSKIELTGNNIRGDISLQENESTINVISNTTGGSIQVEKNRGPIDISFNFIGNQLQCQENQPPPTGAGNSARQYSGQCPAPAFGTTRP